MGRLFIHYCARGDGCFTVSVCPPSTSPPCLCVCTHVQSNSRSGCLSGQLCLALSRLGKHIIKMPAPPSPTPRHRRWSDLRQEMRSRSRQSAVDYINPVVGSAAQRRTGRVQLPGGGRRVKVFTCERRGLTLVPVCPASRCSAPPPGWLTAHRLSRSSE